jgi:hypothetical protein
MCCNFVTVGMASVNTGFIISSMRTVKSSDLPRLPDLCYHSLFGSEFVSVALLRNLLIVVHIYSYYFSRIFPL